MDFIFKKKPLGEESSRSEQRTYRVKPSYFLQTNPLCLAKRRSLKGKYARFSKKSCGEAVPFVDIFGGGNINGVTNEGEA